MKIEDNANKPLELGGSIYNRNIVMNGIKEKLKYIE